MTGGSLPGPGGLGRIGEWGGKSGGLRRKGLEEGGSWEQGKQGGRGQAGQGSSFLPGDLGSLDKEWQGAVNKTSCRRSGCVVIRKVGVTLHVGHSPLQKVICETNLCFATL